MSHCPSSLHAVLMTQAQPAVPDQGPPVRSARWQHRLAAVAVPVQGLVFAGSLLMGLGWMDVWYVLALVQAGVGVGLAARWLPRRPLRVLAVPPVSLLLTVALLAVADLQARVLGCSGDELTAVSRLAPPPGADVQFRGESGPDECVARFDSEWSTTQVLDHYEAELVGEGWTVRDRSEDGWLSAACGRHVLTVRAWAQEGGQVFLAIEERQDGGSKESC